MWQNDTQCDGLLLIVLPTPPPFRFAIGLFELGLTISLFFFCWDSTLPYGVIKMNEVIGMEC